MERTVLFIESEQRAKLNKLAEQFNVSLAEIARRAISAYNPSEADAEAFANTALQALADAVAELEDARKQVREVLNNLHQNRKEGES